jgi:hypothetical protein
MRFHFILTGWASQRISYSDSTDGFFLRGPGDLVGAVNETGPATALTGEVRTLSISPSNFDSALHIPRREAPSVDDLYRPQVTAKLWELERMFAMASSPVPDRIEMFLRNVISLWPGAGGDNAEYYQIVGLSQGDIARFAGVSRPSVENHFRFLKEDGTVRVSNRFLALRRSSPRFTPYDVYGAAGHDDSRQDTQPQRPINIPNRPHQGAGAAVSGEPWAAETTRDIRAKGIGTGNMNRVVGHQSAGS